MKIAYLGLSLLLILPVGSAAAQEQQTSQDQQADSPAEAARRAREQKKDQAKPAKVWDNDNVPTSSRGLNVVGQSEEASGEAANPPADAQGAGKPEVRSAKDISADKEALADLKSRILSLKADLDVLQRKLALDSQTYLSNPNPPADKSGAGALADEQSQVDSKQLEIDAEQKRADELEAKIRDSVQAPDTPSAPPTTQNSVPNSPTSAPPNTNPN